MEQLDPARVLAKQSLVVFGGTGFLGKVWLGFLLDRVPELGHVHLVVRPRRAPDGSLLQDSAARFWAEIATSPALAPLRAKVGEADWTAWLAERITPIPGDLTLPFAGVGPLLRQELRGKVHALVNVAGVVNFQEPLDAALDVHADGVANLVALAMDLGAGVSGGSGAVPILHTSTCYVAGDRTGMVPEEDPRYLPYPRMPATETTWPGQAFGDLEALRAIPDALGWSLDREIATCRALAAAGGSRAARVRIGMERAQAWGWHNTYTFTKALGEQILATSGVPYAIGRPAVIESALSWPEPGWNEGINTSSPLIHLVLEGPVTFAASKDHALDVVPVDQVAVGMVLSLVELLEGRAEAVYQYGTSDSNPLDIGDFIHLVGVYKRRYYLVRKEGNRLLNFLQIFLRPRAVSAAKYERKGPRSKVEAIDRLRRPLRAQRKNPLLAWVLRPVLAMLDKLHHFYLIQAKIVDQYVPFMATHDYRFTCANTRRAHARLSEEDQARYPWAPQAIDWRHYILDIHCPGLERHILPELRERARRG